MPTSDHTARRLWSAYGGSALGFVSLFLLWQWASLYLVSSVLFPPPTVVFKKGLTLVKNGAALKCAKCKRVYPIKDDIPVMLIDEATVED